MRLEVLKAELYAEIEKYKNSKPNMSERRQRNVHQISDIVDRATQVNSLVFKVDNELENINKDSCSPFDRSKLRDRIKNIINPALKLVNFEDLQSKIKKLENENHELTRQNQEYAVMQSKIIKLQASPSPAINIPQSNKTQAEGFITIRIDEYNYLIEQNFMSQKEIFKPKENQALEYKKSP